ncbi:MAG: ATP-dependent metallopeptidase FtsH/Yme1/Tma family protein, partial [Oscillospiraceae bacterium]
MKHNRNRARDVGFYALILVILLATVFSLTSQNEPATLLYSDVVELFKQEKVESFRTEGNALILNLREPWEGSKTLTYEMYDFNVFYNDLNDLIMDQKSRGIISEYDYDEGFVMPVWVSFVPYLGVIIIFGVLW